MQADFTWISFLKFWSFQQGIMFFIARHILFFKIYDFGRFAQAMSHILHGEVYCVFFKSVMI